MDRIYKDRGFMMNVTAGGFCGTVFGLGSGTFAAMYLFTPARYSPKFSTRIIMNKASRHALLLGSIGFAFTLGENFARTFFEIKPGMGTLASGAVGIGTVVSIVKRSPIMGLQTGLVSALILCGCELADFKLVHLPVEKQLARQANNPAYTVRR